MELFIVDSRVTFETPTVYDKNITLYMHITQFAHSSFIIHGVKY